MAYDRHEHILLTTKLKIPSNQAGSLVARPRLYEHLEHAIQFPVATVTAPAGFGKTTLVSDWLVRSDTPAAWVRLERSDNSLTRFWSYVLGALDKLNAHMDDSSHILLHSLLSTDVERMLSSLINTLAEYPEHHLLILDNYHHITSLPIQNSLEFLLEYMPPNMHLIILSRVEPPLPLARLRIRGHLLEVSADDLCFTLEEAREMLAATGIALDEEQLVSLWHYTEGWIVGLQQLARTLHRDSKQGGESSPLTWRTAGQHALSQYLMEEVLTPLPEATQRFLLQTSVLDQMTAALCDAVIEQQNSGAVLSWLDQSRLFITTLDRQGAWYRYSPLFTDFLRQQLSEYSPDLVSVLHLRASSWYERQGMMVEAVEHALAATQFERAADLVDRNFYALVQEGRGAMVLVWLNTLQDKVEFSRHPQLLQLYAAILLETGRHEEYTRTILFLEQMWREQENQTMLVGVFHLRSFEAQLRGDGIQAVSYAQQALAVAHEAGVSTTTGMLYLAAGYLLRGELTRAHTNLLQSQQVNTSVGRFLETTRISLHLGDLYRLQGRLYEASDMYLQSLQKEAEGLFWDRVCALTRLGDIYREWEQREKAEECLNQVQAFAARVLPDALLIESDELAARLAWLRTDPEMTLGWLERAESKAHKLGRPQVPLTRIAHLRIMVLLAQGEQEVAERWGNEKLGGRDDMLLFEQEAYAQARARLLIIQGKAEEAVGVLEGSLKLANQQGRRGSELALRIQFTIALHASGQLWRARQGLEQALVEGMVGGYRRIFIDEGDVMARMLKELYDLSMKRPADEMGSQLLEYMCTLLKGFGYQEERSAAEIASSSQQGLSEPLSEREQEVLRLLAHGSSSRQIADDLVIAESTVKTHIKSIYAKLHVRSRLQAMKRANELGLL